MSKKSVLAASVFSVNLPTPQRRLFMQHPPTCNGNKIATTKKLPGMTTCNAHFPPFPIAACVQLPAQAAVHRPPMQSLRVEILFWGHPTNGSVEYLIKRL